MESMWKRLKKALRGQNYDQVDKNTQIDAPLDQSGMPDLRADYDAAGLGHVPSDSMALSQPVNKAASSAEIGVTGLNVSAGYLYEEFLPELTGDRGLKVIREMSDNDDTVGCVLYALETFMKSAHWNTQASEADTTGEYADFVEGNMHDMEHTWEDFISEVLTYFAFGYSWFEVVFKRRIGPFEKDGSRKSQFNDGRIGLRKLAPRAQESLLNWEMTESGDVLAMVQQPPYGGGTYRIPIERSLHFKTTSRKNNPEGRSLLRNAYVSWKRKKLTQFMEATGIERDLTGIPVIRIPGSILSATTPELIATRAQYQKLARDMKFNEQAGLVIPSDLWKDPNDGKLTNVPMVSIELLSSGGTKSIDTNTIITRYDTGIARTILAEWVMLGSDGKGSYALSDNKTQAFYLSAQGYLNNIAAVLNRVLLPMLWKINGFDPVMMPKICPGKIAPEDLEAFGKYISELADAGFALAGHPETERIVRQKAGLPEEVDAGLMPRNMDFQTETPDPSLEQPEA